jgi:CO/xanthine dehydrogenase FAD-binding subunit
MSVMAAVLRLDDDGTICTDARIVIGAVREGPVRAAAAEKVLIGAVPDADTLAQAAHDASREVHPFPHDGYSVNYMIDNMRVYLGRVLAAAAERAQAAEQ